MVREFENKNEWAIVLGGSSGLGIASAKKLAAHGMNLCLVYRSLKTDIADLEKTFSAIALTNNIQLIHFNSDIVKVEKRDAVLAALKKKLGTAGKVKILLHSIAKGNLKPMHGTETPGLQNDDFHLTIENMGISLYDWTKNIFEQNIFAKDARVLSFTSEGNKKAWKNYAAVSAAKVVLESISRNIALEFASEGIRANCIEAGVTDTASLRMIPGSDVLKAHSIKRNPFQRLTTPEDVANVVYLMAKEEAKWINGAIIPVNGGEHLS
ncbi:MAG: NADP-dependent 7-alpha-hydroxysteroid dehydrogenase [Owenweeksia sp. TMED14]|nr:MAG: NADP-dependent 7-alpha-hydroxysteroid dehydrogenase [Owenweeksia sp. TMED14]